MLSSFFILSLIAWISLSQLSIKYLKCPLISQITNEKDLLNLSPQCFLEIYDHKIHNSLQLSQIITERISAYQKILKQIDLSQKQPVLTQPIIKWAQSYQRIFVNFKLSHRQDSPPCTDLRKENFAVIDIPVVQCPFQIDIRSTQPKIINFGNDKKQTILDQNETQIQIKPQEQKQIIQKDNFTTQFIYQGQCVIGNQKLMFSLNITFNDTIQRISVRKQSLGSYTVIGHKKVSKIWVNPFANKHDLSIWSQMRNKYQHEMDQYFKLLDQMRGQQQKSKKKKRKRKRPSKQSQNNEYQIQPLPSTKSQQNQQIQNTEL